MNKLKFEVGKAYKTRDGHKAIVLDEIRTTIQPKIVVSIETGWRGWITRYLTSDGRKHVDGFKSDIDLIEEWVEELDFDWNCLPGWCDKAIAMDGNGKWFCYSCVPNKSQNLEWTPIETYVRIPSLFNPNNFTGSWKDSLFINPKYQEGKK